MRLPDTERLRVIALLSVAVVLLVGRIAADELGAAPIVEQALYYGALICLAGCLVVIMLARGSE